MTQESTVRGWKDRLAAGPRVFLRRPVEADRAAFSRLIAASFDFLRPWEPWLEHGPDRTGMHRFDRLLALKDSPSNHKTLVCRRDDGALLGGMNVNNIVLGVFQSASLGYWIGAPHANEGYGTEALQLALHYAFRGLGLHRVEANVRPENEPSIRLVKGAGFRQEGYSPRMLKIAGEWADHERWAVLVDEWEPAPIEMELG